MTAKGPSALPRSPQLWLAGPRRQTLWKALEEGEAELCGSREGSPSLAAQPAPLPLHAALLPRPNLGLLVGWVSSAGLTGHSRRPPTTEAPRKLVGASLGGPRGPC